MPSDHAPRTRDLLRAAFLIGAVVSFVAGYVGAVTGDGVSFSWRDNMVSDLGTVGCRTFDGLWICSPRSAWFNAALIVSGVCVLVGTALMRRRWGVLLSLFAGGLGIGLGLLGLFPSDTHQQVHMVGAVLALPVAAAGVLVSAVRPETLWLHAGRRLRGALGVVGLTMCLDHVVPGFAPIPRGIAETVAVATILAFLGVEGARCAAARRTGAGG